MSLGIVIALLFKLFKSKLGGASEKLSSGFKELEIVKNAVSLELS
jgi:hypothetical protein